jgi:hypothetical protein
MKCNRLSLVLLFLVAAQEFETAPLGPRPIREHLYSLALKVLITYRLNVYISNTYMR